MQGIYAFSERLFGGYESAERVRVLRILFFFPLVDVGKVYVFFLLYFGDIEFFRPKNIKAIERFFVKVQN